MLFTRRPRDCSICSMKELLSTFLPFAAFCACLLIIRAGRAFEKRNLRNQNDSIKKLLERPKSWIIAWLGAQLPSSANNVGLTFFYPCYTSIAAFSLHLKRNSKIWWLLLPTALHKIWLEYTASKLNVENLMPFLQDGFFDLLVLYFYGAFGYC